MKDFYRSVEHVYIYIFVREPVATQMHAPHGTSVARSGIQDYVPML
jgi:hypothetical protein